MLVMFAGVAVVKETAEALRTSLDTYSPTLPVAAESFVVLPITPDVLLKATEVADAAPRVGVTNTGDVASTLLPVPVLVTLTRFFDASVATADEMVRPLRFSEVPVAAPTLGVTNAGDVAKTATPVPVSSVKAVARAEEEKEPREAALPLEVIAPVRLAFVVTFPAVRLEAVPVRPVPAPVNEVDDKAPVDGLKVSFVEVVFCGRFPVFAVTHVGNIVAFVDVSSVIAVFVAFVAVVEVVDELATMEELQANPVPLVHCKALEEVLHDGTLCPVGATAVREPRSWFADNVPVRVPAVVAAIEVLQLKPEFEVQLRALPEVEQEGAARGAAFAVPAVALPTMVLLPICWNLEKVTALVATVGLG